MTASGFTVRTPAIADIPGLAHVHVEGWRETYREIMPAPMLDDPEFPARRERFWTAVLTDPRNAALRSAVAEVDGEVVGLALARPPHAEDECAELYALYLLAAHHGSGAGAALLDAVIPSGEPASLWVAEPNPRAQGFYRKSGFVVDGTRRIEDGVLEVRMVRPRT